MAIEKCWVKCNVVEKVATPNIPVGATSQSLRPEPCLCNWKRVFVAVKVDTPQKPTPSSVKTCWMVVFWKGMCFHEANLLPQIHFAQFHGHLKEEKDHLYEYHPHLFCRVKQKKGKSYKIPTTLTFWPKAPCLLSIKKYIFLLFYYSWCVSIMHIVFYSS